MGSLKQVLESSVIGLDPGSAIANQVLGATGVGRYLGHWDWSSSRIVHESDFVGTNPEAGAIEASLILGGQELGTVGSQPTGIILEGHTEGWVCGSQPVTMWVGVLGL